MTTNETSQLLAEPSADLAGCLEEWNGNATGTADNGQKFALWQVGALCGILLAYADTSLVWATHETVASHFDNLENSSWMMTSFTIGYCVTLPLYGRLSDNYGRLRPLIAAYCTFCIGCTLWGCITSLNIGLCEDSGVGQAYWQVILGRIITGCGASGIISLASIIITDIAEQSNVAVLRSYVNVASTVGLSLGGPLGGFLGGTIGWRWGLRTLLPKCEEDDEQQPLRPDGLAFDFPGAITLAIGISSLLTVIDLQNRLSWEHPLILGITIIGGVSILVFLALESYPGNRELLIPLRLLKTEIGAFCAGQLLIVGSCHGFVSQIAPYFANTQGASDAEAGGQTVPSSIGNAIGNLIAGQIIKKFRSYKRLSIVSLFLCIATSILILFQWSHPINTWEALTTLPFGLFAGIVLSTQFIGLYICAPKQDMATAISMYYMSQQIGIAIGISLSSSLLKQQFQAMLQKTLVDVPGYKAIIKSILTDSSLVALLPEEVKSLVWRSYLNSFWVVPAFATATQVLALLPMVSTTEKHLD
ncbi:hypothetical protein B7494_g7949 [Chlorociboria aeruginascens]|nr:hypothetical protein B7494_g7949 [Chlorociboria aeruginascens]